ncbi:MAG TPA: hypothetical protein VFU13_11375 [Steroidobacteraceae bacterium]|nr:hypothetical protein [Steroidobacteraceae bacterium]
MSRQLVLIHGRAQENKDSKALKAEWLDALEEGLAKSNLALPIAETDVRFPYYGDTLFDMVDGKSADTAAEIVVRGTDASADEQEFTRRILEEIRQQTGITTQQIAEVSGQEVVNRGPLNWEWFQGVLRAIDRHVPHGSGASIALFTHDVYCYLKNDAIRKKIEDGVSAAMKPGQSTVVVSHSLGTVVAYNLFRREGHLRGWKVPLFITVGSPLGIQEIRKTLKGFATTRCPECADAWFNAMDERDVVALYPLKPDRFPLDPVNPAIVNKTDVRNRTANRHGIAGYLDDKEVAKRIFDALSA